MKESYMLSNPAALKLYEKVQALPIVDYHCHLSPKEIYEDKPFDNIGAIWLAGDHYKWRLMRQAGLPEQLITGSASWHDKFIHYIEALSMAAGNPLYHWSEMELKRYFDLELPIRAENAEEIWIRANQKIKDTQMSPRKLIVGSKVEVICTTDDLADDLCWHEKLAQETDFPVSVLPSFRCDQLLLMQRADYSAYLQKLSERCGFAIVDLVSLKQAIADRLDFFVAHGCKIADVGIPFFPDHVSSDTEASETFQNVLNRRKITKSDYLGLLGNLYLYLGKLYVKAGILSQWHLAVARNASTKLYQRCGADSGGDCVGDAVDGMALIAMLDRMEQEDALPQTILYSLNPQNLDQIATIAGAFRGVRCGAAWWFNDHSRGIRHQLEVIAENGVLGEFFGMLTDSRSFLSYARHDYFRRILCSMVGKWVEAGEFDLQTAVTLVQRISYQNIKDWMGETR